jgi:hypothetical protein
MEARAATPRPEPERRVTWPLAVHAAVTPGSVYYKGGSATPSIIHHGDPSYGLFEEDLENNPEYHFLSPIQMYEYEDWAEESDSDAEEVEWDAGITDFALFDDDRRRAQESNRPLPNKWTGMLAQQTSALKRAVERHRRDSDPQPFNRSQPSSDDEMPSLTPDVSPDLRDDLDVESYHGQSASRPGVPNYLTITITPPEDEGEDEDLPLSFYVARKQARSPNRKIERPGLRHSRTMSGRAHTWTRPSMFTVGEDSEGEERAKRGGDEEEEGEIRGRR